MKTFTKQDLLKNNNKKIVDVFLYFLRTNGVYRETSMKLMPYGYRFIAEYDYDDAMKIVKNSKAKNKEKYIKMLKEIE